MNSTAFVSGTAVLPRSGVSVARSSLICRKTVQVAPRRQRAVVSMSKGPLPDGEDVPQVPQGFTGFSEKLNGRAAMVGFAAALLVELLTGKGIIGQLKSIFGAVTP